MKASAFTKIVHKSQFPKGAEVYVASDGSVYANPDLKKLKASCQKSGLTLLDFKKDKVIFEPKSKSE